MRNFPFYISLQVSKHLGETTKKIFINKYLLSTIICSILLFDANAQQGIRLSLPMVIDDLSLEAPAAEIQHLNFENEILQFENYKKGLLPSVSINMSPISLNRSIVKLQQASDGQYHYVEDYSSSSSAGISVQQKIPFTGGTLNASTNLNYLNELSQSRNSFNSTPFSISYSQQLFGGGKTFYMEKSIEYLKNEENINKYCSAISDIQQNVLNLFMNAFFSSLEKSLSSANKSATDSLLNIAIVRQENRRITESDFNQIELQASNNEYLEKSAAKNHEDAVRSLVTYLGLNLSNYRNIIIETPKMTLPVIINPEKIWYYIDKNNPTLLNSEIRRLEAKKNLYTSGLQNKFNANINMSYGMNQYAENFLDAYRSPRRQQIISVSFSIPFSMWGINRNTARIAQNNYRSSILRIENEINEYENEINITINNYNHNINLWHIAERSYQLTQDQYRLIVLEFSKGRSSAYQLIASQQEQSTAMQKYYSAVRNAYESYYKLRGLALYDFESESELADIFLTPTIISRGLSR